MGLPVDERPRATSVARCPRRGRFERFRALVTKEVVPGEDVVDLKTLRARVTLADVALQERVVAHDGGTATVAQQALRLGPLARLTGGMLIHRGLHRARNDAPMEEGSQTIARAPRATRKRSQDTTV